MFATSSSSPELKRTKVGGGFTAADPNRPLPYVLEALWQETPYIEDIA
jgi:hypothetical protein